MVLPLKESRNSLRGRYAQRKQQANRVRQDQGMCRRRWVEVREWGGVATVPTGASRRRGWGQAGGQGPARRTD